MIKKTHCVLGRHTYILKIPLVDGVQVSDPRDIISHSLGNETNVTIDTPLEEFTIRGRQGLYSHARNKFSSIDRKLLDEVLKTAEQELEA